MYMHNAYMWLLQSTLFLTYFRDGVGGGMDGSEISKEVIEEQFAIILSRDYAHMLGNA